MLTQIAVSYQAHAFSLKNLWASPPIYGSYDHSSHFINLVRFFYMEVSGGLQIG